MDKTKHRGALDGANEDEVRVMQSVWIACLSIVLVILYIMVNL